MNKTTIFIIVGLVVGAGLFYNFTMKGPKKSAWQIEYVVNCESCDISYKDESGETLTEKGVTSAWTKKFTGQPDQFLYLSAMTTESGKEAAVKVIKDGEVAASDASSNPFAPAKASVTLFN